MCRKKWERNKLSNNSEKKERKFHSSLPIFEGFIAFEGKKNFLCIQFMTWGKKWRARVNVSLASYEKEFRLVKLKIPIWGVEWKLQWSLCGFNDKFKTREKFQLNSFFDSAAANLPSFNLYLYTKKSFKKMWKKFKKNKNNKKRKLFITHPCNVYVFIHKYIYVYTHINFHPPEHIKKLVYAHYTILSNRFFSSLVQHFILFSVFDGEKINIKLLIND